MKKIFLLLAILNYLLVSCMTGEKQLPQYELSITDTPSLSVPIPVTVNSMKIRVSSQGQNLIYMDGLDLVYFNYISGEQKRDSFLRNYDYAISDVHLEGVLGDNLILADHKNLIVYHPGEKELTFQNRRDSTLGSENQSIYLSTSGRGVGSMNRTFFNYVPLFEFSSTSYRIDKSIYIYQLTPEQLSRKKIALPADLIENIYNCNNNLMSCQLELDLSGQGINLVFSLSCRIFHIDGDDRVTEYPANTPEGPCEINNENFVKATADNFFPKTLPIFGKVLPDKYRKAYYQFYFTAVDPDIGERRNYLRILDELYQPLSRVEINWDEFNSKLLILKEGTFIQSSHAPDESRLYFHKLELSEE